MHSATSIRCILQFQPSLGYTVHPADIHAALKKAGATQVSVARSLDVSHSAVQLVLRGATKSARIATQISQVTGLPVSTLFPGQYPKLEMLQRAAANGDTAIAAALAAGPDGAAALVAEIKALRGPGAARAPKPRRAPRTQRAA